MSTSQIQQDSFQESLAREASNYQIELSSDSLRRLGVYYSLITHWNPRLHLVAPCSPAEFATRHILESLMLIQYLPTSAAIADIGSGAGLPLLPCLIVRPDLSGFLIESSRKKTVFLNEALKQTETTAALINERFELTEPPPVQFVSCRAIEKFETLLPKIVEWAPTSSTLFLFGGEGLQPSLEQLGLTYTPILLPQSEKRFLYVATAA